MRVYTLEQMTGGWFIGNFTPTALRTAQCEVGYMVHKAGSVWASHYHRRATEITLLVSGEMQMQDRVLHAGDIFEMPPWEVANPQFLTDCAVVVVKCPSVPGDKYIVPTVPIDTKPL